MVVDYCRLMAVLYGARENGVCFIGCLMGKDSFEDGLYGMERFIWRITFISFTSL